MGIYDFKVKDADAGIVGLDSYKGKVLLIVNTASYCGYTKQLMGLEREYKKFKDRGLEILAFPANQFLNQEPDPIDEIVRNYHEQYGVSFPIFDKIMVNGDDSSPLFTYLKQEIGFDASTHTPENMIAHYKEIDPDYKNNPDIKWNFTKFLIDKQGKVRHRFEPEVTPSHLVESIEQLLAE